MFFTFSKIGWMMLSPANFIAILWLAGLACLPFCKKGARFFLGAGTVLFLLLGLFPVGHNMLVYLEGRYEAPQLPARIDGVIVLGGAFDTDLSARYGVPQLNSSADRLFTAATLSRKYPQATIVHSGRSGSLYQKEDGRSEADDAESFFNDLGFENTNLLLEDRSRNTYENALFSKEDIMPAPHEVWVLVTSAYHMPRARAVFDGIGWKIIPYPVDFQTGGDYILFPKDLDVLGNLYKTDLALHEFIGYLAYRLTGKISSP